MRRVAGISAVLVLVSLGLTALATHTFEDVPNSHTFHEDIDWLETEGVTKGCNPPANTEFCPDDDVTRGQMAAFLVRYLGLTVDTHSGFSDVDRGSTFASDIGKLATAGITRGCNPPANTRFCPDDPVTREQMAAFLVRGLDLTIDNGWRFDDVDPSSTFVRDISKLASSGVTKGCGTFEFCPKDNVTRGQMAAFLRRGRNPGSVNPSPSTTTTTQPSQTTTTTTQPSWSAFTINGSGNDVVSLSVPGDDPALIDLTHDGSSNFVVWSLDAGLDTIDLIVNEIGPYDGRRGLNIEWLFSLDPVRNLEITADGTWSVTVRPVSQARLMSGSLNGNGDEVVRFNGAPAVMHSTHNGSSNFIIVALEASGEWNGLIVNEIGPYNGNDAVPAGTRVLSIQADGAWTLSK